MIKDILFDLKNLEYNDADNLMKREYIISLPTYQFLNKIKFFDSEILEILLYNICQRVVPSWESNLNDKQLRPAIFAFKRYLLSKDIDELVAYDTEILSPKVDCSYSDTSGAAATVYNSIRFVLTKDVVFATYALSDADIANTLDFEKWLEEIAVPNSLEKKICNYEETKAFSYDCYDDLYLSFFEELKLKS
ncbi:hypothetical protein AV926_03500 [Myroides marinus]|uniref:Uncharacterized protein n=1 Tax=Myroides marinus TaxID=703342 RepID=A0A161UBE1_9FLAO|nr:hypothetical protein [Myroides marinus]KZE83741.1 hypothetical protein AV926_03500 [Myroides marinus]